MAKPPQKITAIERITTGIGSVTSLVVHTVIFVVSFGVVLLGIINLNTMLLVLTTILSLEAIYLAIFIQMSVNINTRSLREVESDIDEIQEDVEELGEDFGEIQEDMGEIQEDLEEMSEDVGEIQKDLEELGEDIEEMSEEDKVEEAREVKQATDLERLTNDVRKILTDLESLKKG
jgi:septal ring factor EnvC (AmiA/AmiB activator)